MMNNFVVEWWSVGRLSSGRSGGGWGALWICAPPSPFFSFLCSFWSKFMPNNRLVPPWGCERNRFTHTKFFKFFVTKSNQFNFRNSAERPRGDTAAVDARSLERDPNPSRELSTLYQFGSFIEIRTFSVNLNENGGVMSTYQVFNKNRTCSFICFVLNTNGGPGTLPQSVRRVPPGSFTVKQSCTSLQIFPFRRHQIMVFHVVKAWIFFHF